MTAPPRIRPADRAPTLAYQAVDHAEPADTEQKFSLSATQVMASMAAAVTAALVGSRLGVAGTVIGAGLASVISVVGGAVIGHSILLTRKQVQRAVLQVRGAGEDQPADDLTTVIPAVTRVDLQRARQDARTGSGPGHAEPGRPRPTRPSPRRVSTGVLFGVAAALAIFVSSLGAVTLFETIKGSPLSGGLSVLGGNGGSPVEAPATTTTAVVTEQSTVTQTVTSEVTAPVTSAPPSSAQSTAPTTTSSAAAVSSAPQVSASAGETRAAASKSVPSASGSVPASAG
jgi:hypothetical protein